MSQEVRHKPIPWAERRRQIPGWAVPFFAVERAFEWTAYVLSKWTLFEVLDYAGKLSVLVAVFFYFHDSDNRVKQRHYQAWQVINTAQGKGGSGGRIDALQELNQDGVPLVGVDVSGAFLQGIILNNAKLLRADFSAADVRNGHFVSAYMQDCDLHSANFRHGDLRKAMLAGARMDEADLQQADLSEADLSGVALDNTDLRFATLTNANWSKIHSIQGANVYGLRNPPDGFLQWALRHGAVQMESDEEWEESRSGG
jgi:hypothetical protein